MSHSPLNPKAEHKIGGQFKNGEFPGSQSSKATASQDFSNASGQLSRCEAGCSYRQRLRQLGNEIF